MPSHSSLSNPAASRALRPRIVVPIVLAATVVAALLIGGLGAQVNYGLRFDGVNDAVTFGAAPALGTATFTVETWFSRQGAGVTTSTGALTTVVPLVAKGRGEADTPPNVNMNYLLGIQGGVLAADYEECAGPNHPILGVTPIPNNTWNHAAVTYDGSHLKLYLNGILENDLVVASAPCATSIQHAGLGTAYTSTGVAGGFFNGVLDESRIWNVARTQQQILTTIDQEVASAPGLIGRWGLNEGTGTTTADTSGSNLAGTIAGGATWVSGTPFARTTTTPGNAAIDFGGAGTYVAIGNRPSLGLQRFTLEAWFNRQGQGATSSTGSGGTVAVPLVTKGRAELDASNVDMNYFLGIRPTDNVLVADFEDFATGLNHPVAGTTPIANDTWYHAAATYDGTTWRLYLNGLLEATLAVNQTPRNDSIQHSGIGAAFNSTGVAEGAFAGVIDEVRIWNHARSEQEIQDNLNLEMEIVPPGLVSRWGFNQGQGTAVTDSSLNSNHGTVVGSNWAWVPGAPFNIDIDHPPALPVLIAPPNGATGVSTTPTLEVSVSDPDDDPLTVTFLGRESSAAGPSFTLVAVPDTQFYSESHPATFTAQTQWILDTRAALNTVFVTQLGDIVQNIDAFEQEWINADTSMSLLDGNLPYNLAPGNHDMSSAGVAAFYDQYFPALRYLGVYDWYAGNYRNNKNSYQLFSASGLDFIALNLEYDPTDDVLVWANAVLAAHPSRRAIISTHLFLNTSATRPAAPLNRPDGNSAQEIWNTLIRPNCNVFLVLNGHYPGEAAGAPGAAGLPEPPQRRGRLAALFHLQPLREPDRGLHLLADPGPVRERRQQPLRARLRHAGDGLHRDRHQQRRPQRHGHLGRLAGPVAVHGARVVRARQRRAEHHRGAGLELHHRERVHADGARRHDLQPG